MPFPNESTQFQPGQSGNPKGRPKKLPEIDELMFEVLGNEDGTEAKEILNALVTKAKKGDVRAAEVLLDRAYGKAKQILNAEHTGAVIVRFEEPNLQDPKHQSGTGELPGLQERSEDNSQSRWNP